MDEGLIKKLKLHKGSTPYRIHVYLLGGGHLTHAMTANAETSPIGMVLNLAPRIKDLRDKYENLEDKSIACPLKSHQRKPEKKAPYTVYYYAGVGCAVETEAKEAAKRDMNV